MKKLAIIAVCALSTSVLANEKPFFDQKGFEQDTAFYQEYKQDAKAIITLVPATGIDRDMVKVLTERANGKVDKWQKLVSGLQKSREYANKIGTFNYLSECSKAVTLADTMWSYAVSGVNRDGWRDNFSKQQYEQAQKEFKESFLNCKKVTATPPNKEDYYSENEPIVLGEEK